MAKTYLQPDYMAGTWKLATDFGLAIFIQPAHTVSPATPITPCCGAIFHEAWRNEGGVAKCSRCGHETTLPYRLTWPEPKDVAEAVPAWLEHLPHTLDPLSLIVLTDELAARVALVVDAGRRRRTETPRGQELRWAEAVRVVDGTDL